MAKKAGIFALTAAGLVFLGFLAYTNLEIYPRKVFRPPSRAVFTNDFFALEKWLAQTGHPVRFIKKGNPSRILSAPEKTVFIQAAVFDWDEAGPPLRQWIEEGGFLVISLETPLHEDEGLDRFLADLGAAAEEFDYLSVDSPGGEDLPDFDPEIQFTLPGKDGKGAFTMEEPGGLIRLVEIPLGSGAVVFMGRPRFMWNDYLEEEKNARLSWDLTGARAGGEEPGLLFIRAGRETGDFFGKLAERGNFLPLGISVLILIVTGFWMVIPSFGLLFYDDETSLRPIRERFRAETRFLKKYGALEKYLAIYIAEIKRKLRGREPGPLFESIEKALGEKKHLSYKELIRSLQILGTIMESL